MYYHIVNSLSLEDIMYRKFDGILINSSYYVIRNKVSHIHFSEVIIKTK